MCDFLLNNSFIDFFVFLSLIVFIQVNIFIGFINNLILSDYFRDILLIFLAIFFSEVLFRDLFPLTCHTNVF